MDLSKFDGLKKNEPSIPRNSSLLVRCSRDGFLAGIFYSLAHAHIYIPCGSAAIEKDRRSCEGGMILVGELAV